MRRNYLDKGSGPNDDGEAGAPKDWVAVKRRLEGCSRGLAVCSWASERIPEPAVRSPGRAGSSLPDHLASHPRIDRPLPNLKVTSTIIVKRPIQLYIESEEDLLFLFVEDLELS